MITRRALLRSSAFLSLAPEHRQGVLPHQVLEVLAQVPANRLMIGSDLPENTGTEVGKILTLDVSAECKRAILSGTARRVLTDLR